MWRRTTPSEARQEPERVTRGRKAGVRLRGARWARGDGTRRCRYRQYSIEIKYVFIRTHIYKLQFSTRPRKEPMGRDTIESERHRAQGRKRCSRRGKATHARHIHNKRLVTRESKPSRLCSIPQSRFSLRLGSRSSSVFRLGVPSALPLRNRLHSHRNNKMTAG